MPGASSSSTTRCQGRGKAWAVEAKTAGSAAAAAAMATPSTKAGISTGSSSKQLTRTTWRLWATFYACVWSALTCFGRGWPWHWPCNILRDRAEKSGVVRSGFEGWLAAGRVPGSPPHQAVGALCTNLCLPVAFLGCRQPSSLIKPFFAAFQTRPLLSRNQCHVIRWAD